MLEGLYFQLYEIEMLGGEVRRAVHFLEKSAKGKGFYADAARIILDSIGNHIDPEEIRDRLMGLDGEDEEKKAIYFRFLYSYNRYNVKYPYYDSMRCNDE
ncbi:MAG: hypothetical protein QW100_02725 [Thermoplasmatales archaeon]